MKHLKYILTACIAIIVFIGCKRKDDPPYYALSERQKTFSNFKEGSYWIMRDSITGRRDSFIVSYLHDYTYSVGSSNTFPNGYNSQHRYFFIEQYRLSTAIKEDTVAWSLLLGGSNYQYFAVENPTKIDGRPVGFGLDFINSNVLVNSINYNGVAIADRQISASEYLKIFTDSAHVLLKIVHQQGGGQFVWELEHANLIR